MSAPCGRRGRPGQDLPGRRTGAGRRQPGRPGRHRARPARPERGRQVDHRQDPHHAGPGRLRHRPGGRPRRGPRAGPGAPGDRLRVPEARRRPGGHRPGEPGPPGPPVRAARRHRAGPGRRAAGPLRAGRRGRPAGPDVLRRHAAQARRRDGAGAPAAGALPGRADDRAGPGGAGRDVDPDRRADPGRGPDRAADHPLPGGGRPAGRPGGLSSTTAGWSRPAPRRS